MAINRSSLSAQDIATNYDVAIELVTTRPDVNEVLATAVAPGVMVGFYNNALGVVELYVTDPSGLRYIRVG